MTCINVGRAPEAAEAAAREAGLKAAQEVAASAAKQPVVEQQEAPAPPKSEPEPPPAEPGLVAIDEKMGDAIEQLEMLPDEDLQILCTQLPENDGRWGRATRIRKLVAAGITPAALPVKTPPAPPESD